MPTEASNLLDSDYATVVRTLVAEHFAVPPGDVTLESRIVEDLGADSLDMAELVLILEGRFGVKIQEQDVFDLQTVGDVVAYAQKLSGVQNEHTRPVREIEVETAP